MLAAILALVVFAPWQATAPLASKLSLNIACGAKRSEIRVTMQNSGDSDTAVLLGHVLANGKWYLPRNFVVEIVRPDTGQTETLIYEARDLRGGVAGRIDHWVMPLPGNASVTLTLRAIDFISIARRFTPTPTDQLRVRFNGQPITSALSLDMTGVQLWQVWTGTLESNTLRLADCPA